MIVKIIFTLLIGYLIGRIHTYYKYRVQCVNCGSKNTVHNSDGYGGCGGKYPYAVKHYEGHTCKECGEITSIKMSFK